MKLSRISPGKGERIGAVERAQVLGLLSLALDAGMLPVEEYDTRVAAVSTATHAAELAHQVADMPPEYAWGTPAPDPPETLPPPPSPAAGRIALILGIASVPLAVCVIGGVLGVLAVIASLRGGRPVPGGPRITAALVGRVFGILGIILSIGAVIAIGYARDAQTGP